MLKLVISDDGQDWSVKGLCTLTYLGRLWQNLDLDILIVVKNAPGKLKDKLHQKGNLDLL